jgi:hypothetical protein
MSETMETADLRHLPEKPWGVGAPGFQYHRNARGAGTEGIFVPVRRRGVRGP